jgi:hypothetical protein
MVLIQITEKALEVSPYNSIAYGVLVSVLLVACGALWLKLQKEQTSAKEDLQKEQEIGREQFVKVTEIMTRFLISFDEDKALREEVKSLLGALNYEREDNKQRAERLKYLEKIVDSIYDKIKTLKPNS